MCIVKDNVRFTKREERAARAADPAAKIHPRKCNEYRRDQTINILRDLPFHVNNTRISFSFAYNVREILPLNYLIAEVYTVKYLILSFRFIWHLLAITAASDVVNLFGNSSLNKEYRVYGRRIQILSRDLTR